MSTIDDERWKKLNAKAEVMMMQQDWFGLGHLYYTMAEIVKNKGADGQYLINKGYEFKLMAKRKELDSYKNSSVVNNVEVLANPDMCGACFKNNGKICSLKTANEVNLLPVKDCSNVYGCRCTYLPVIDESL